MCKACPFVFSCAHKKKEECLSIKRIFFDSGMVLVYPLSGNWTYPQGYYDLCRELMIPSESELQKQNEVVAYSFINKIYKVASIDEEYAIFSKFFKTVFSGIEKKSSEEFCEKIVHEVIFNYNNYKLYDDVIVNINKLNQQYALGVISNAFPSLRRNYYKKGVLNYFDKIIISSEIGIKKNNIGIFKESLKRTKESPDECLFIDDSIENCRVASRAGLTSIVMDRNNKLSSCEFQKINNLDQLANILN